MKLTVTDDGGVSNWVLYNVAVYAPSPISLVATAAKVKGVTYVTLSWSGFTSSRVDVFRNNAKHATADNSGSFVDDLGKGTALAYPYRICEAGTSVCSRTVYPTF